MQDTLMSTGQVATRLNSSRQHIVDMCERGELNFVRVGKHRRIPTREIERLLNKPSMSPDAARSLWLHRVVVSHLIIDPDRVMQMANETLDRRIAKSDYNGSPKRYYLRWKEILRSGVEATAEVLTDVTEESDVLRSCSPFVGVISQSERQRILESFKSHWDEEHAVR